MLKDHIARSGKSREHWAERLGIGVAFLSQLLNGKKKPSLELAVRIERETGGAIAASSWIPATEHAPAAPEAANPEAVEPATDTADQPAKVA